MMRTFTYGFSPCMTVEIRAETDEAARAMMGRLQGRTVTLSVKGGQGASTQILEFEFFEINEQDAALAGDAP